MLSQPKVYNYPSIYISIYTYISYTCIYIYIYKYIYTSIQIILSNNDNIFKQAIILYYITILLYDGITTLLT